jgi:hypothetical protein
MNMQEQTKKNNGQWYMMLPEPYRMQAINNAERDNMLGGEASSLGEALFAFPWDATPQGHQYWQEIFEKIKGGKLER